MNLDRFPGLHRIGKIFEIDPWHQTVVFGVLKLVQNRMVESTDWFCIPADRMNE